MERIFKHSAIERLTEFLQIKNQSGAIEQLTPDASTREFFRIEWQNETAIACVYPENFDENLPQIDVTRLFRRADLPVAEIYGFDGNRGVVVHEDFGDLILRDFLLTTDLLTRENLIDEAIRLIARIQAATPLAFATNSIAGKLRFDEKKLLWELNFFKTHYFESLRKQTLSAENKKILCAEFAELSLELEGKAKYLTHRDFHAANLMIDRKNQLRIIDHQDARIGSIAYDLVSLLLDRVLETPDEIWLTERKIIFLDAREKLGSEKIALEEFNAEFDLMTIQRGLKAVGTFANQTANLGKTNYAQFILPMFRIVLNAARKLNRFPHLQMILSRELNS